MCLTSKKLIMKIRIELLVILFLLSMVAFISCNNAGSNVDKDVEAEPEQVLDEAKVPLLANDVFVDTINGVRVVMEYKADNKYFKGSLENVTEVPISGVKVNIYLSNGLELNKSLATELKVDDAAI